MAESLDLGKNVAGAPLGVWVVGGTAAVGGVWYFMRRKANSKAANSSTNANQPATIYAPATSGDFSNDQAQAIFSDIRNLQGQEVAFTDTASQLNRGLAGFGSQISGVGNQVTGVSNQVTGVGNQVSGVSQQISKIPAGPIGPPGPAGVPGAAPPPPPPPPPPRPAPPPPRPPQPTPHMAVVRTDGTKSLNYYASAYGTARNSILAQTARSEPSDYNSPSSRLHQYIVRGAWSDVLPAGYTLYVPYVR
jgi:hypothetical protein